MLFTGTDVGQFCFQSKLIFYHYLLTEQAGLLKKKVINFKNFPKFFKFFGITFVTFQRLFQIYDEISRKEAYSWEITLFSCLFNYWMKRMAIQAYRLNLMLCCCSFVWLKTYIFVNLLCNQLQIDNQYRHRKTTSIDIHPSSIREKYVCKFGDYGFALQIWSATMPSDDMST